MKRFYTFFAVMLLMSTASFSQSKIDSILNYTYASASDSTLNTKKHFDTYDDSDNLIHKTTYKWNGSSYDMDFEESWEYTDDVKTAYQKVYADHVDDFRVEYKYDTEGNLIEEVVYSNKNEGSELDPEWERALKKEYSYKSGEKDTVVVSAFVKYWQPARKIKYEYSAGPTTTERVYKWLPEVKVKEFEGVYGQNADATRNYIYRAYKVEQTVKSIDELANIYVPEATTVVNIFKADGTRYDITSSSSPGGKSLKELLGIAGITSINQLRDNYREWFKTVKDDKVTLINVNIKAGRNFDVQEVIKTTTDLYSYNEDLEYLNTAYWVKGAADTVSLKEVSIPSDIDWVNIYVKENDPNTITKYRRIDIAGADAAGKTLKEIFGDSITVDDLFQDYEEWFYDKNNNRKVVRLNVKAMKMSPQGSTAIDVYKKLYSRSDDAQYILNAYKVNSGAKNEDLAGIKISKDAYKVTIYKNNNKRTDIWNNIQEKSLLDIFGDSISVDDLDQNRVEWFYNSDGQVVLLNINVKEEYRLPDPEKVEVKEPLYSIGTNEDELIYENTAILVHDDADINTDLKNYYIPADADYVVVYRKKLAGGNITFPGPGVKTSLADFMSSNSIDVEDLRQNYWEWFVNTNKRRTLVKLNIKPYEEIQPVHVMTVDSLYTGSQGKVYSCVAYKVASSAEESDLDFKLPDDLKLLDYYLADGTASSLHPKDGATDITLGAIMKADGNKEGITITIDQLRDNYYEWFINDEGKTKMYNINFKAVTVANDGKETLTKQTDVTFGSNGKEAVKIVNEDKDNSSKESWTKYEYTYKNDDLATEEKSVGEDGSTYTKESKKVYYIDAKDKLRVVSYYIYTGTTPELEARDFYFYEDDTPTAIKDKPQVKLDTRYYPNPVGSVFNVHVQDVNSFTYRIFSLDGSVATMGEAYSGTTTIDVSSLKQGIYILNIVSGDKSYTTKIVKK